MKDDEKKRAYNPRKFFDIIYLNLPLNFILYLFATFYALSPALVLFLSAENEKGLWKYAFRIVNSDYTYVF